MQRTEQKKALICGWRKSTSKITKAKEEKRTILTKIYIHINCGGKNEHEKEKNTRTANG